MSERRQEGRPLPPERLIAGAIQSLVAARLGRAFVPLGLLFVGAVALLASGAETKARALLLALGALLSAGGMLAHGLRVVQRSFGRRHRAWMSLSLPWMLVPPVFAVWVVGGFGARSMAAGTGLGSALLGAAWIGVGIWVVWGWFGILEVGRLARIMSPDVGATPSEDRGGARSPWGSGR